MDGYELKIKEKNVQSSNRFEIIDIQSIIPGNGAINLMSVFNHMWQVRQSFKRIEDEKGYRFHGDYENQSTNHSKLSLFGR